jgi:hypothetical protein
MGVHLGVWIFILTFFHISPNPRPCNHFCLGREPKARVVTNPIKASKGFLKKIVRFSLCRLFSFFFWFFCFLSCIVFFYFTLHLFDVFCCCLGFFVFQLHCFILVVLFHLYHSIVSSPTPSCCFINRAEEPLVFCWSVPVIVSIFCF